MAHNDRTAALRYDIARHARDHPLRPPSPRSLARRGRRFLHEALRRLRRGRHRPRTTLRPPAPPPRPVRRRPPASARRARSGSTSARANAASRWTRPRRRDSACSRAWSRRPTSSSRASPPGRMAELGLDFEALRAIKRRIILVSITPYGQTGPRAQWQATNLTSFASGGQMALTGDPHREPLVNGGYQAEYQTGFQAFAAAATAAHNADVLEVPQHIDISAQECMASALELYLPWWEYLQRDISQRRGNVLSADRRCVPCEGRPHRVPLHAPQLALLRARNGPPRPDRRRALQGQLRPPQEQRRARSDRPRMGRAARTQRRYTRPPAPRERQSPTPTPSPTSSNPTSYASAASSSRSITRSPASRRTPARPSACPPSNGSRNAPRSSANTTKSCTAKRWGWREQTSRACAPPGSYDVYSLSS